MSMTEVQAGQLVVELKITNAYLSRITAAQESPFWRLNRSGKAEITQGAYGSAVYFARYWTGLGCWIEGTGPTPAAAVLAFDKAFKGESHE